MNPEASLYDYIFSLDEIHDKKILCINIDEDVIDEFMDKNMDIVHIDSTSALDFDQLNKVDVMVITDNTCIADDYSFFSKIMSMLTPEGRIVVASIEYDHSNSFIKELHALYHKYTPTYASHKRTSFLQFDAFLKRKACITYEKKRDSIISIEDLCLDFISYKPLKCCYLRREFRSDVKILVNKYFGTKNIVVPITQKIFVY